MSAHDLPRHRYRKSFYQHFFSFHLATFVLLACLGIIGAIALAWLTGETNVSHFFEQLYTWQQNPPHWLEVPDWGNKYLLLLPTIILCLIVQVMMKLSPQPCHWSQRILVVILLALIIRYLCWRLLTTLNLIDPLNGIFSIGLLLIELFAIFGSIVQLYLLVTIKSRRQQADKMEVAVNNGTYYPQVDILIPTYNEPTVVLRRTIIGCQALDYQHKKIYLLDDLQRQEIKELAIKLGCNYLTRLDNFYAKAGNLNHALTKTKGEIIAVFDADFVPTKNFLTRTVGFFQDPSIGLLQTHQSFYNPDPVARNLGLEQVIPQEVEVFSRYYQVIRDGIETAICYGSSFVVRRSYLEETGGFVTDSLSEDYFTSIRLSAQGHRVIYLNESLSAGLSAENISGHVLQRLRWTRGTLQAFFIDTNPLTIRGINPLQRLAHLEGLLQWFGSLFRVILLFFPLAYAFWQVVPLRITAREWVYFFLPFYFVQLLTFSWLNRRSRSALVSDLYSVSLCFPIALTVVQTMIRPFSQGFKVTPKGVSNQGFVFNWTLALPLICMLLATGASLWQNIQFTMMSDEQLMTIIADAQLIPGMRLAWVWSMYNLFMITLALFVLLDVPKPNFFEWFKLRRVVKMQLGEQIYWGVTKKISEVSLEVVLTEKIKLPQLISKEQLPVNLTLMETELNLSGVVTHINNQSKFPSLIISLTNMSLEQQRKMIEMLFCRPGQWESMQTPGEFKSLLLLLKALFMPRVLFDRKKEAEAAPVSQV